MRQKIEEPRNKGDGSDLRYSMGSMLPLRQLIGRAHEELTKPYPAVQIQLWEAFSKVTGGLRANEFSIICGATGTGKTTFLANLSSQLLMQNVKHFVASVETGPTDFVKRVISALVAEDLNTGEAVPEWRVADIWKEHSKIIESDNLFLSLFEDRVSLEALLRNLEIAHARYGCKVAMLDNLNFFMEVTAEKNSVVEMDNTVHELIMFCKRIDMHVIMVMHPKKTLNGRVESEFDIKGSSTAVQEAHNVFLFNRPSDEDEQNGYSRVQFRELKIAKLRRRGKYVGSRIMFKNFNSCYTEAALL